MRREFFQVKIFLLFAKIFDFDVLLIIIIPLFTEIADKLPMDVSLSMVVYVNLQ